MPDATLERVRLGIQRAGAISLPFTSIVNPARKRSTVP